MWEIITEALIYILPAYIANSSAVLFGGGKPIDLKKTLKGKRILGDGKTIRGFTLGLVSGSLTGVVIGIVKGNPKLALLGFLLSLGGLIGDIVASFLKRRINLKRGRPVPILDQLDFIFGALAFGSLLTVPSVDIILFIIILTPLAHLLSNRAGYWLGLKDNPW